VRQEEQEFKARLRYIVKPCLKINKQANKQRLEERIWKVFTIKKS
jgi:hypothetical protein